MSVPTVESKRAMQTLWHSSVPAVVVIVGILKQCAILLQNGKHRARVQAQLSEASIVSVALCPHHSSSFGATTHLIRSAFLCAWALTHWKTLSHL
jgi:hypothetical protein